MSTPNDTRPRDILPIPDVTPVSTTTYDAKDPETKYPSIVPPRDGDSIALTPGDSDGR